MKLPAAQKQAIRDLFRQGWEWSKIKELDDERVVFLGRGPAQRGDLDPVVLALVWPDGRIYKATKQELEDWVGRDD